ncbi:hypothetical protein RJ639_044426 [Escallonia herrerae]|uniref:Uncharacterized protein n=1 Tax=Escallonia herrerae TaxID=1293975 RepID=A0AA88WCW2_9ASTE|nr:hypothetical protein RJ639_044426 [Escallonia herrerae]
MGRRIKPKNPTFQSRLHFTRARHDHLNGGRSRTEQFYPDHFQAHRSILEEDSSSDSSSSFFSEAASCDIRDSNRDSTDDMFDYIFGDLGPSCNNPWRNSSDSGTSLSSSSYSPLYNRHSPLADSDRLPSTSTTTNSDGSISQQHPPPSAKKRRNQPPGNLTRAYHSCSEPLSNIIAAPPHPQPFLLPFTIAPDECSSSLSRGGARSLIMGSSRKSWNQALSKGMVSSSISFTSVISSIIRIQIPIQPMAMSAKPIASPPKKRFPSRPLSRVFIFSRASFAAFSCSSPTLENVLMAAGTH